MSMVWREENRTFHLYNEEISYIMQVLPSGHLGQLYFGKRVHDREDFSYLLESLPRPMASCVFEGNKAFSLEHIKQEYPSYGTGDYRAPAVEVLQEQGASAVGVNCSVGPDQLLGVVESMKKAAKVPLIVKPNAGIPVTDSRGNSVYPMTPEKFAEHMKRLAEAGAGILGGCCGTTPEHIRLLRQETGAGRD